jgi:hypothetical protein
MAEVTFLNAVAPGFLDSQIRRPRLPSLRLLLFALPARQTGNRSSGTTTHVLSYARVSRCPLRCILRA